MLTAEEKSILTILTSGEVSFDGSEQVEEFYNLHKDRGLNPFFYSYLKERKWPQPPSRCLDLLSAEYLVNSERQARQKKIALQLIQGLNHRHVSVMVLKGPLLEQRIYGSSGWRSPSADIDFLIQYKNFSSAEDFFKTEGYQTHRYGSAYLDDVLGQVLWGNGGEKPPVDLHWRIIEKFSADLPESLAWENSFSEIVEDVQIRFLSNDVFFLYLCMVLWKEAGSPTFMKYFLDLHHFFKRNRKDFNYDHIMEISDRYNLKFYVLFFFLFSRRELEIDYQLENHFRKYIEQPNMNKRILNWAVQSRQFCPQSRTFLLKKAFVSAFFFSKGSVWGILKWFYQNFKANYLLHLYFKNLKPDAVNLTRHFLSVMRKLFA